MGADLFTTGKTILEVFGAIAIIGGGANWLLKLFDPFKELKKKVEEHSGMLSSDKTELKEISDTLGRIERQNNVQSWALLETMNHLITGNDIDKLEKRRDDLLASLIQRGEHE